MELVILYGAPGVGKLTVAEALARQTGYKVFHNHLTLDLVTSLFDFGSEQALRLSTKYRIEMLGEAAQAGVPGVIFTFVYGLGADDAYMQALIDAVERHGAHVTLVLLRCDTEVLLERVARDSRAKFRKLRDPDVVRNLLADHRLTEPFPHRPGLVIDNTHRSADEVTGEIMAALR